MDFSDKDIDNNNDVGLPCEMDSSDIMWEWRDDEYFLQTDSGNDFSQCLWDNVNVNEDSLMYMLDEQTPIKDITEFGYPICDVVDSANKGMEEYVETSQMKRRRMLQFNSDANETGVGSEQFTSLCLKSKVREGSPMENGLSENSEWYSEWNTGYQDDTRTYNFEGGDQASEGWLANCLNESEVQCSLNGSEMHCNLYESEMHCSLNEMDDCMVTDDQVDASEFYNVSRETGIDVLQETPNPSPIKFIKGINSFLKTPKKLVTPVVYPFALIKPCGVQGDVTLKDINQRIHAPPPSRSKHKMDEDLSSSYPTSAFSGKPVVLKAKICTEGGKGSITIMRTKG